MSTRSAYLLLLVVVLLGSTSLEVTTVADAIPKLILEYDYLQNIETFFDKANFVANQLVIHSYEITDVKNPTLLVLLVPFVGSIIIRAEFEKIKFYNIQRFVSLVFIIILISSVVITPYTVSTFYWGYALAKESNSTDGIGSLPYNDTITVPTVTNFTIPQQIVNETAIVPIINEIIAEQYNNNTVPEPAANNTFSIIPQTNYSISLVEKLPISDNFATDSNQTIQEPSASEITITLQEQLLMMENITNTMDSHDKIIQLSEDLLLNDKLIQKFNGTIRVQFVEQIAISDNIIILFNNETVPPEKESSEINDSPNSLVSNSIISDSIFTLFTNGSLPAVIPNATESWQFENDTDGITLVGDASINDTEGFDGESLDLDGDHDYVEIESSNATTYLTDMAITAWVKPNYTNGSPEFTVLSKGKSFVLSINNLIETQRIAKFAVFDGIKWSTVESYSKIPEGSWTHLTARFNKTAIEIYVNGTREDISQHDGIPYVSESGQIELKMLAEITSYYDIIIGASVTTNIEASPYNMFSGQIDGVKLYDYRLQPEDIIEEYLQSIPLT